MVRDDSMTQAKYKLEELSTDKVRYFKTKKDAYDWAESSFGFFVTKVNR